ncbi:MULTISPECIES: ATP-binding cassette domain-containing protein [Limimaricola]|uniref:ATP-binding cassette domain-containing protein n=1 Tax=Limimaricola litoreus TaxID=2955316 RepID=A0A9X2FP02_9RHOB|nr:MULTISPECIES: ATP-binding cassette domain-containing protein [Limimaricola]MCP1167125.1 ATP-binding cassette domain-containing protein [Limimaricola litoreus]
MTDPLKLSMRGLVKRFGGVVALDSVDFELRRGEVMALVGDNGAGKSTLIKTLAGAHMPDEGVMEIDGAPVRFTSPQDAWNRGVATIFQELALAGKMTIADNIFLGREIVRKVAGIPFLDRREMHRRSKELLERLDVVVPDIHTWVEYLSGGQRQGVAIARALNIDAEVIVMDEPTAALAVAEVRKVLEFIKALRRQGKSVVLISHNVQDVMEVSDRITVLRRGRRIGLLETANTTPEEVVGYITGAALAQKQQLEQA